MSIFWKPMCLDIFVNKKTSEVGLVKWFKDPKWSSSHPSGPLIRMTGEQFRRAGCQLVKAFFEEYERVRIESNQAVPVFAPDEERKYLKNTAPVTVFFDQAKRIILVPGRFRKFALGGLATEGPESFRKLPWDCTEEEFWACFDEVLEEAS